MHTSELTTTAELRLSPDLGHRPAPASDVGPRDIALGQHIKAFREAAGLNLPELAEKVKMSVENLEKIENGTYGYISPEHKLPRFTEALGVCARGLYSGKKCEEIEAPTIG